MAMKTTKKPKAKTTPRLVAARQPVAWRRWGLVALATLLAAGGTWALLVFVVWNRLPSNLVGKWVVVGGAQDGATFDFHRDGLLIGRVNMNGMEGIVQAEVRVEDDRIYATSRHPETGVAAMQVQKIRVLTAKELIVEDERGEVLHMERAR